MKKDLTVIYACINLTHIHNTAITSIYTYLDTEEVVDPAAFVLPQRLHHLWEAAVRGVRMSADVYTCMYAYMYHYIHDCSSCMHMHIYDPTWYTGL